MKNRLIQAPLPSLEGCLLVASPDCQGELYERSVCLVVNHSSEGAVGVILNKGIEVEVADLWQKLAGETDAETTAAQVARPLYFGGPKSGPVVALHNRQEFAEYTPGEGVYLAAQVQNLQALVRSPTRGAAVKIIVGQANWEAGCLEEEFARGKWLPLPLLPGLVFADADAMWGRAIREIGNQFVAGLVGLGGVRTNVWAN